MKNGFTHPGHAVEVEGGSRNRFVANVESGAGNERLAGYANLQRFREHGWRDLSESWAENGFATVGWRGARASLDLDFHASRSELTGNGLSPRGLLARDRASIFTAPDITENDASLWTLRGAGELGGGNLSGQLSWRSNDTASFNGDGLDEDDVGELVEVGFGGVESLRDVLPRLPASGGGGARIRLHGRFRWGRLRPRRGRERLRCGQQPERPGAGCVVRCRGVRYAVRRPGLAHDVRPASGTTAAVAPSDPRASSRCWTRSCAPRWRRERCGGASRTSVPTSERASRAGTSTWATPWRAPIAGRCRCRGSCTRAGSPCSIAAARSRD